ncbi:AAA family ATPase [Longimicrobium terrae]|uniref:ATPase AAA-type core domain-containing protein n=1 Tax=Longimicrobium terrae TaxID=1639882 RepID=A0A841GNU8_9BACT|nr:AAA family ATPase [Longimicrobium terrae]MBB4635931.1 hypothetical protein [Longimicrobium terrae]MBB6070327.1 hypothetical protein [Longimicrobium terrae]NNC30828.1 AAA family ATPase [Longimicrobium terrae]
MQTVLDPPEVAIVAAPAAGTPNPLVAQFRAARRVSVPLVAITTPDAAATIQLLAESLKESVPQLAWDAASGLRASNSEGQAARAMVVGDGFDATRGNPQELFTGAAKLPPETVLFVLMANRWLGSPAVIQALWNLRDRFKCDRRTVVLLGTAAELPPELAGDVLVMDDPLPGPSELAQIVREQCAAASLEVADHVVDAAVEAVRGLSAFGAEQSVAMSLRTDGLDLEELWERKRQQVQLTPGLRVHKGGERFEGVGGVPTIKSLLSRVLLGNDRPGAVVFLDEIEKFMGGAAGQGADTSGVAQDQLGTILGYMQDHGAAGALFVGPPGSAKSMIAKACGPEGGIPTIQLDLGEMKGSLMGQSEHNLRTALKVITSVSNGRSLWLATSNNIFSLPPELRRRFTLGVYFFDLPSPAERNQIWDIWLRHYGLSGPLPPDPEWTGAEVQTCCDIAHRLRCTLVEAAAFVVPVSRSAPDQVDRLRSSADGKYLSASTPGVYRRTDATLPPGFGARRMSTLQQDN